MEALKLKSGIFCAGVLAYILDIFISDSTTYFFVLGLFLASAAFMIAIKKSMK